MNRYVEPTEQLVVEIFVRDIKRSTAFYQRLGFEMVRDDGDFVALAWEGHQLFLFQDAGRADSMDSPVANVRVMVPNVDDYWKLAQDMNARVLSPITDQYYGLRDFMVADPDGFGVRFASYIQRDER